MGFNGFPFRRKQLNEGVSKDLYPQTKVLRDNREAINKNVDRSVEYFDTKFAKELDRMFGPKRERGVRSGELTQEEEEDIKNFIEYASKRLAAAAISSKMFHKQVEKGKVGNALSELAPVSNVGHDSIHAMMAYAQTGGRSLVPAYAKLDDYYKINWRESFANLEEDYVIAFSELDSMAERLIAIREALGLAGEELVQAAIESWENEHTLRFKRSDPSYPKQHRMPEFENIVRNLLKDVESDERDPNFAVHEFQRILSPLLMRLREKGRS